MELGRRGLSSLKVGSGVGKTPFRRCTGISQRWRASGGRVGLARIGRHEYPEIPLTAAVEVATRIAREFSGVISRGGLARALGISDRGGRFAAVVGALRAWGIAEGRSAIRLTQDGLRAAAPLSQEESFRARQSLACNVPMFAELAARLGNLPPERTRVALMLEEITGAGRLDVERRLPSIQRLFRDALPYLATSTHGASEETAEPQVAFRGPVQPFDAAQDRQAPRASGAETQDGAGMIELSFSGGRLSLPETLPNIEAVLAVLEARREELRGAEQAE